jgi:hypothetical protein
MTRHSRITRHARSRHYVGRLPHRATAPISSLRSSRYRGGRGVLALAWNQCCAAGRIVTLPALARSVNRFPMCPRAFAISWRVPCKAARLYSARCLRILRSLAPILPLLLCSFAQATRDARSRTMPRRSACRESPRSPKSGRALARSPRLVRARRGIARPSAPHRAAREN